VRGHREWVTAVAFTAEGRGVCSVGVDGQTRLWELAFGAVVPEFGHQRAVHAVAVHPGGNLIATAGEDRVIRLWNPRDGVERGQWVGHFDAIKALAFSPDGRLLASASDDLTIRLWDVAAGREVRSCAQPSRSEPVLAFSADGERLISWSDRTAHVWITATGKLDTSIVGHDHALSSFTVSPDGRRAAFAAGEYGIRVWQLDQRRQIAELKDTTSDSPEPVQDMIFLPSGDALLAVDAKGGFHFWSLQQQKVVRSWSGPETTVLALVNLRQGERVAAYSADQMLRIYDVAQGKLWREIKLDVNVQSLAVHPTEPWLFTANQDGTVYVLDVGR